RAGTAPSCAAARAACACPRSEEHTSELQSRENLVCRLLLEKKKDIGMPLLDATLDAVKLRLRPIIMTSFAFILGIIPLMISTGAGSFSHHTAASEIYTLSLHDALPISSRDCAFMRCCQSGVRLP